VKGARITRTALILVGRALGSRAFEDSRLYDPRHHHVLRPKAKEKKRKGKGDRGMRRG
jgi:precorrin-4/cobalt-precorrin-4 C11-methyltransferase